MLKLSIIYDVFKGLVMLKKWMIVLLFFFTSCSEAVLQPDRIEVFQGVFKPSSNFLTENKALEPAYLSQIKKEFSQDLRVGNRFYYETMTGFSILLLAGSEGSHFSSSDPVFAGDGRYPAILVTAPVSGEASIYKGLYRNRVFFAADQNSQLAFTGAAWLLIASDEENITIHRGELTSQNSAAQPPATNPTVRAFITPFERHTHEDSETAAEEYLEHQDPNYQEE